MESEVLNEKIQSEARRVAAAFGVEEFERLPYNPHIMDFSAQSQGIKIRWTIDLRPQNTTLRMFAIVQDGQVCQVALQDVLGESGDADVWTLYSLGLSHDLMARGLYCLGFENENLLAQLNHPLSMHEKLELRLSMPREFWPQRWLDEEKAAQTETL